MSLVFCMDSCSLMTAMRDTYPLTTFPRLWDKVGEAFEQQVIISSEMVFAEIAYGEGDLVDWIKPFKKHFLKVNDSLILEVGRIVTTYETLVDASSPREQADPYLIALAKIKSGVVVTEEKMVGANARRIKIPNVCQSEGLRAIRLIDMIKELKWTF